MQLFLATRHSSNGLLLDAGETHHLTQVLRMRVGEWVHCTDGQGRLWEASFQQIVAKQAILQIQKEQFFPPVAPSLHIAIAPTKNIDRFEWFLEKTTEIGITSITPLICKRSERTILKYERLTQIVATAMKQSLRFYLPNITQPVDFKFFIKQFSLNMSNRFIAHCGAEERVGLKKALKIGEATLLLIGPEGDFTTEEISLALSVGFQGVSLGEARYRTETAGIVACHTVQLLNENF